jgi:hypothetical protein
MKMEEYYRKEPTPQPSRPPSPTPQDDLDSDGATDDYDRHRQHLVTQALRDEGWRTELARYLADIAEDVMKDTDIVVWWGVCIFILATHHQLINNFRCIRNYTQHLQELRSMCSLLKLHQ